MHLINMLLKFYYLIYGKNYIIKENYLWKLENDRINIFLLISIMNPLGFEHSLIYRWSTASYKGYFSNGDVPYSSDCILFMASWFQSYNRSTSHIMYGSFITIKSNSEKRDPS